MKYRLGAGLIILSILGVGVYAGRGVIRETWRKSQLPELPAAQPYAPRVLEPPVSSTAPVKVPEIVVSSTIPVPPKTPKKLLVTPSLAKPSRTAIDPFVGTGSLPEQVNLAVPFLSQAPKQNWAMPYQEACEEASLLMVDAFYRGKTTAFTPSEGDRVILDLVAFEEARGKTPDLTAAEVAEIAAAKWGYDVVVTSTVTPELVKRALANGYPVILPADGKRLENPNFRNGGPPYHMLVIKGYVNNRHWITNDPGTRLGADFVYRYAHLLTVARDWNGGDVPQGIPKLIVLIPRS